MWLAQINGNLFTIFPFLTISGLVLSDDLNEMCLSQIDGSSLSSVCDANIEYYVRHLRYTHARTHTNIQVYECSNERGSEFLCDS